MKFIILLLLPCLAHAGSVTLSWSSPVTRANGDALEQGDIKGYKIEYSCNGKPAIEVEVGPVNTHTIVPINGQCKFRLATKGQAYGHYSDYVYQYIKLDAPKRGGFR